MDIRAQVSAYIVGECLNRGPGFRLAPDQTLLGEGLMDSLQMLQLVQFIEDRFGVAIDDTDLVLDNFLTVDHIVAFVRRKHASA